MPRAEPERANLTGRRLDVVGPSGRVLLLSIAIALSAVPLNAQSVAAGEELILRVGMLEEMKTRNLLGPGAYDAYTAAVQFRVYSSVLLLDPAEGRPVPYVAKGVDYDEDGTFELAEYGVFAERDDPTSPLDIVVYYDFNGVTWHDGTQMTVWDLLFSYHLNAMSSRFVSDLRVLFCGGTASTYLSGDRCLSVEPFDADPATPGLQHVWEGESTMAGTAGLRAALRFRPSEPSRYFYDGTLRPVALPAHIWSRTGGGRHADFGCAVWIPPEEAAAKGLAECGTSDPTKWGDGIPATTPVPGSHPFEYSSAQAWNVGDADVIGHGPFRFGHWTPGVEAVVLRNDAFYTGEGYDARLAAMLQHPRVEGIRFLRYRTEFLRAMALRSGDIDVMPRDRYYSMDVPSVASDLMGDPRTQVLTSLNYGYAYLAYNMRKAPWGYEGNDPTKDVGYWLRRAIAHAIDKEALAGELLVGFGTVAHGFVSPANSFWYNDDITKPEFSLSRAREILDSPEARANGTGLDPPGPCSEATPSGCRSLARIGTAPFELWIINADYDWVRHAAGRHVGEAMRSLGLNAVPTAVTYGGVSPPWTWRNEFDMFLLAWSIGPGEPDYLFEFFHSAHVPTGQNYCGLQSPEFDSLITAANLETDRSRRRDLLFEAQWILSEIRPCEPLYYPASFEAYRRDRFVNWTMVDNSIWNEWSLLRIRPSEEPRLNLGLEAPASLASGKTATLRFLVRDPAGLAVAGTDLSVEATSAGGDPGTFEGGGATVTATTAGDGTAEVLYRGPVVDAARSVTVRVTATNARFAEPSTAIAAIRVVPIVPDSLRVRIGLPAGASFPPGSRVPLRIDVLDPSGRSVPDASVRIASSEATGLVPEQANGTAVELAATSLLVAQDLAPGRITVTVRASRAGFADEEASVAVDIVRRATLFRCPTGSIVANGSDCPPLPEPASDLPWITAWVGVATLAAVAGTLALRRRAKRP